MHPLLVHARHLTRRQFFGSTGVRLGGAALALLAGRPTPATADEPSRVHPPLPGFPHFAPRAKAVIYLHMNGGPSQLDTFDYKPGLAAFFDKELPGSVRMGQRITFLYRTVLSRRPDAGEVRLVTSALDSCASWIGPTPTPR